MAIDNCGDWAAVYIRELQRLEVTGQCTVSDSGHAVQLVPTSGQDAPPRTLLLELVVDSSKNENRVETGRPVLYRRDAIEVPDKGGSPYEEVHIVNAGVILKVEEISRADFPSGG
ncbi:MAG TPA: hypothetical protein VFE20_08090 [Thermoleophilia bacterium]|nr:hypothetical protein [Thermoleophilia bacterium]